MYYTLYIAATAGFIHAFRIQPAPFLYTTSVVHQKQNQRQHVIKFHHGRSSLEPLLLLSAIDQKQVQGRSEPTADTSLLLSSVSSIYSLPALYDLAFGYRDYEGEVEFLFSKHMEIVGSSVPPKSILEIAAGPARHSITALLLPLIIDDESDDDGNIPDDSDSAVPAVYCIDTSTEMASYAQQVLQDEMDQYESVIPYKETIQQKFQYQIADMRNFTLLQQQNKNQPIVVDTVWILLGSLQHMLTNTDVIDCFRCIYHVLATNDGTVFIELPHPRESTFNIMECTRNGWKVPLVQQQEDESLNMLDNDDDDEMDGTVADGGELSIVWGDDGDIFDPITQVRQFSICFDVSGLENDIGDINSSSDVNQQKYSEALGSSIQQVVPMRLFTAQEIDALARCAGFEVVAMYGALEHGVDVDDKDASYRLVCVLQKQSR